MRLRAAIFFCLFFVKAVVHAQTPFFSKVSISSENSKLGINAICIDKNRFIWLATDDGILKDDGRKTTSYSLINHKKGQVATSIFEDSKQNIWVGFDNGTLAQLRDSVFSPVDFVGQMPLSSITSITEDKAGRIWISTSSNGIFYIVENKIFNINSENGLSDDYAYSIVEDRLGRMWIGTDDGISICALTGKSVKITKLNSSNGVPEEIVRKIIMDDNGDIWAGLQEKGVCKINSSTLKISIPEWSKTWNNGQVNDLLFSNEEIWIASEEQGLFNARIGENEILKNYQSFGALEFHQVSIIKTDAENNLWLATKTGLIQSQGNWLMFLNEIGKQKINFVHAICYGAGNKIFFTPDQELVAISIDGRNTKAEKYLITPVKSLYDISNLYADEYGYVWIGTMGDGLYRLNPENGSKQHFNLKDLAGSSILCITGQGNTLWLATLGGVIKCMLPPDCNNDNIDITAQKLDSVVELGNYYIYTVFIDSKKRIWFGTDKKGITVLDNGKYLNYNTSNGLKGNTIYSVTEDTQGDIWFSIAGHGICRYDGRSFKNYGTDDGLRELNVASVKALANKRIAMIHRNGIDILHTDNGRVDYYGARNNLEEINPDLNAVAFDNENRIWIATEKGIVVFDPAKNVNPAGPKIILQRLSMLNLQKNFLGKKEFKYNQNYLAFDFTGIWSTDPGRIKYQYMLKGFNKDWINTSDNKIIFPNLPPGSYTFLVRASLNKSFTIVDMTSYNFTINKPFWTMNWFRALVTLFLFFIGILFIKNHDNRLRRIEALKKESVEYRFETLKSQVNPHFLFNSFNTLINIIEKDKDIAVEYVEKLSDYFRNMIQHREKETISLKEEIEMVNTYYYLQKKRFGNYLQLEINIPAEALSKYKVPPLSLQLLIENAVKHNMISKESPLNVEIYYSDDNTVTVKNNINIKLNKEVSTGIGLENIASRYNMLSNRKVLVFSDHDIFTVTIPLIT